MVNTLSFLKVLPYLLPNLNNTPQCVFTLNNSKITIKIPNNLTIQKFN